MAQLYHDFGQRIYCLAWRMLRNNADAEDVAQEVLLQVMQKLGTFRGEADVKTWLHRITVNAVEAHRRKRALQNQYLASEWANGPKLRLDGPHDRRGPTPDKVVIDREELEILDLAIKNLSEKYRRVYLLSEVEGLSNQEIARMLGLSLAAVKSRLHRGRLFLREALAPYFAERDPDRESE
jgi:RNA polymerase sigma-70 factor (ECF subfamily)